MANTVIQLKFSNVTATPPSLNVAEPAYSYASNTFFIGSPDGTGAIAIGGKFYLDQQQGIFNLSNAAFNHANSAFAAANNSTKANAAFDHANSAFYHANSGFIQANAAFNHANAGFNAANTADAKAITSGTYANAAFNHANAGFIAANTADSKAVSAGSYANSAFLRANNSLNANTGGQISGDLSITGNLTVTGNVVSINTSQIVANDSLIILAAGNYTADILDIGFAGHYNDGSNAHTGLIRDAGTKEWQLFEGYTPEIGANNNININDPSFKLATINANVHSTLIRVKGIDLLNYVNNAYEAANTADAKATSAGSYANSGFIQANSAIVHAQSAFNHANSGFIQANSAYAHVNASFNHANAAFSLANGTAGIANTDVTTISVTAGNYGNGATIASFTLEANGRISQANSTLIGISATQVTVGTLPVARGGTGTDTFTNNGVLLGQGTGAFTTASSSTEGHVLTINNSGVPTFAHLSGGTF